MRVLSATPSTSHVPSSAANVTRVPCVCLWLNAPGLAHSCTHQVPALVVGIIIPSVSRQDTQRNTHTNARTHTPSDEKLFSLEPLTAWAAGGWDGGVNERAVGRREGWVVLGRCARGGRGARVLASLSVPGGHTRLTPRASPHRPDPRLRRLRLRRRLPGCISSSSTASNRKRRPPPPPPRLLSTLASGRRPPWRTRASEKSGKINRRQWVIPLIPPTHLRVRCTPAGRTRR